LYLLAALSSCGSGGESRVIDFSDTVDVAKPDASTSDQRALKVAVAAMISPKDSFAYYRELLDYLGRKLGKRISLVQRKTYREINELLGKGRIDIAFICSGPYASSSRKYGIELLAVPEVNGSHFYQSYLIVNSADRYRKLEDLRDKSFAFTDPESNTGRLVPVSWLADIGERPETFFRQSIFTFSHDNSIMAVAKGLVDGAAVDGLIWEYYARKKPDLTARTRIIKKSARYGIPPIVASARLSTEVKQQIQRVLLNMHNDPDGRRILNGLMIDRFIVPRDEWYDPIRKMIKRFEQM
jgi:phosphonate transport system substrate-binding protein